MNIRIGGFLVILVQDIRKDGYLEPLAKRLVDMMVFNGLRLKEIVIVTKEEKKSPAEKSDGYLRIAHQYLLVYEKTKGDAHVQFPQVSGKNCSTLQHEF